MLLKRGQDLRAQIERHKELLIAKGEKSVASAVDPAERRPLDVHEVYFNTDEVIGGPVIQLMELKEVSD